MDKIILENNHPMIIEQIQGNLKDVKLNKQRIEKIQIEWFEATKRIQRRKTTEGTEVAVRFMKEGQRLQQDDILYMDDEKVIIVDILPCDAIQVKTHSMLEIGSVCYEIGNKHLPVFIQDDLVLIPYEDPIFKWLTVSGYHAEKVHTKLLNIVNASVHPHGHSHGDGSSIFSKIMNLGK